MRKLGSAVQMGDVRLQQSMGDQFHNRLVDQHS